MQSSVNQHFNTSFFNGIYQEVWRRMIPPGLSEAEVTFIEEVCNLQKGQTVLDLMCGYGRHSLELAKRGYKVDAIDSSEGYVEEVRSRAAAEELAVTITKGDVSQMTFDKPYQAAICMGNSFAFFNEASVQHILQQLARILQSGSCFVINTWMIGEIAFRHFQEKVWNYVDEYKYLIDSRYLINPTRIEADHIVITPDGKVETIQGVDYIFTLAELEKMFQQAGFRLKDVFYTPKKRPFKLGDNKAYIVAVRE
jgi:ubiquinone/menaquinone biosynthesis C-methylase UbiE